jgi:phosphoglycerate kinase
MAIKTISELDISGRRVFIRVDFNVPFNASGAVSDDTRIRESLPTIKHAIEKGARVVLASHLGRPKGKPDKKYSLEPVAARLAELIGADVALTDEPVGDGARKVVNDLHAGAVALLENLRFSPGEEANDENFSRALASYTDVYVNDAFGTAHRAHASTAGIAKLVGDKGIGLLMEREVKFLGRLLGEVERPFVAIIGGAKVSDKIGVLENLLARVDQLLIGGAMANTFLKAKGGKMGRSLVEDDKLAIARAFLKKAEDANVDVLLPRDVIAAAGTKSDSGRVMQGMAVPDDLAALDIGPDTARGFADAIARAKTSLLERSDGCLRIRTFAADAGRSRRRRLGAGASRSWAAATRSRPCRRAAWPTRSPTSRPAAALPSNSSRARSYPAWRHWRARWPADVVPSFAATGS